SPLSESCVTAIVVTVVAIVVIVAIVSDFFGFGDFNEFHFARTRYYRRIFRLVIIVDIAAEVDIAVNDHVSRNMETSFFVIGKFRYAKLVTISIVSRCWTRFLLLELFWTISLVPLARGDATFCRIVIAHAFE